MPALRNQRWERFCQLVVFGADTTQAKAYIDAGYKARGNSAEVNSCRLLRIAQPVVDRIHELQQEQKAQLAKRDRYTREALAERMVLASQIAEEDRIPSAITGAEQLSQSSMDISPISTKTSQNQTIVRPRHCMMSA